VKPALRDVQDLLARTETFERGGEMAWCRLVRPNLLSTDHRLEIDAELPCGEREQIIVDVGENHQSELLPEPAQGGDGVVERRPVSNRRRQLVALGSRRPETAVLAKTIDDAG